MPQIHIKLPEKTHKSLKKKAKEYNFSVQEFVERTLETIVSQDHFPPFVNDSKGGNGNAKPHDFTFIDLFAGIGGIRIPFEKLRGKCVFTSEWDRWCQKTYLENFGEIPEGDITKIAPEDIPDHDILTAGFPCQPFSIAGVSKKEKSGGGNMDSLTGHRGLCSSTWRKLFNANDPNCSCWKM